ncbi:DUF3570 domain-containing protein [Abyssalbus ytuae]|uniref:DUF3570 domain-containing protein n=1 Tax=Abyssalbus ytuae TaxID=2926907 RepID=A0A9E6ZM19_9FLAO|nr:DUF3570 domain-containing protein [Abyssalbus ytuae]UOB16760.1 DUF3570 domain-containing protein [Abyssalbus ytuae]
MKKYLVIFICAFYTIGNAQDTTQTYKKRVLESAEVDILFSYYKQDGDHAAVTGGEGTEELTDITPTIVVSLPLNDDDVLTVDAGISAYTSASSSNINPFDTQNPSPWISSSGASSSDALVHFNPSYSHSSDNRNNIWTANLNVSAEYDYFSIGFGGGYTHLFNEKNSEFGIKAQAYIDKWNPQYPVEFRSWFNRPDIVGDGTYTPSFAEFDNLNRNSYSLSFSFSQILTKKMQGSLFFDLVMQDGLLSTPHQRVYFADVNDFFVGDFQLGDDVEQLPDSRFKVPIGGRLNYYLNDIFTIRTYYRYYFDDWGINSHTANIEVPIKLGDKFTVYPMYRFYNQTAADYFAPKEQHLSTEEFYTSDYDLSDFDSHQYGLGISYKDIFTSTRIWKFGLKSVDLRFNQYSRSDGLDAFIVGFGIKFVQQ